MQSLWRIRWTGRSPQTELPTKPNCNVRFHHTCTAKQNYLERNRHQMTGHDCLVHSARERCRRGFQTPNNSMLYDMFSSACQVYEHTDFYCRALKQMLICSFPFSFISPGPEHFSKQHSLIAACSLRVCVWMLLTLAADKFSEKNAEEWRRVWVGGCECVDFYSYLSLGRFFVVFHGRMAECVRVFQELL